MLANTETAHTRHFACTACGKCCTRGPEMELGEATALADQFITRLIFKLHSLPINEHAPRAALWWKREESALPISKALAEARRHLAPFTAREEKDAANARSLHLTISALPVHVETDRCPALTDNTCAIYERRPLSCRTVPFHYSRAPSTMPAYLDRFVRSPGYQCDTTQAAPVVFQNGALADAAVHLARLEAAALAQTEKEWKGAIVELLHHGGGGFPRYAEIARNSDAGNATTVPMFAAWKAAVEAGVLTLAHFTDICEHQARLLRAAIGRGGDQVAIFRHMLDDYEAAAPRTSWRARLRAALRSP